MKESAWVVTCPVRVAWPVDLAWDIVSPGNLLR
jgi:hypothetical protein